MIKGLYLKVKPFNSDNVGGSISHTIGMINGFNDIGIDLTVLTESKLKNIRARQIVLPIKPYKKPVIIGDYFFQRRYQKSALNYIKKNDYDFDFVYCRHCLFNNTGIIAARYLNKPLILEFNSSEPVKFKEMLVPFSIKRHGKIFGILAKMATPFIVKMMEKWEQKVLDSADKIVVVSDVLKQSLISHGLKPSKIIVRPNGVDPNMFKYNLIEGKLIREKNNISSENIVAGFAGTFGNWHGIPELTEAIKKTKHLKNLTYMLIGEGSMKKEMQNELEGFDNVIFAGRVPFEQMPAYLSSCDILIVSNSWNPKSGGAFFGSPTKMFEYMSMGRAIVSSRLEQLNEILRDMDTALTFEPCDIDGLSKAIEKAVKDKNLREQIGSKAREKAVKEHTWAANAQAIVDVLPNIDNWKEEI